MKGSIALAAVLAGLAPGVESVSSPMSAASRVGGAAPLSVFFDAIDSLSPPWKSGVLQPDEGDPSSSDYAWSFGDPKSGAWPNSGRSRDEAFGPVAAHVYETPGLYTVTLKVTDRSGKRRVYAQKIQVLPPEGPAFFLSSTGGNDAADGRSPQTAWRSLERARKPLEKGGTFFLKRGDSFPLNGPALSLAGAGGRIGAYGPGDPPVIQVEGSDGVLGVFGDDWRVTDLRFVGPGESSAQSAIFFNVQKPVKNTLIQRVSASGFRVGIGWGDHTPMYATPHDANTMAECEVFACPVNGIYVGGRRLALLGNTVRDIPQSHVARVWQAHKAVIQHNAFKNPGPERHALKLHGPTHNDGRPPTQHVVVSDNVFAGKTWTLSVGPQNAVSDERVSHVLLERNRTFSSETVQVDFHIAARQVTIRNNIFSGTGSARYYAAVEVVRRGVEPEPADVRVLHNTVLKADEGSEFSVCLASTPAQAVEVMNNLAWAPKVKTRAVVTGPGKPFQEGNLLAERAAFLDDGRGLLKPLAEAARGGRPLVRVRSDFSGAPRPRGGPCALGAFEP